MAQKGACLWHPKVRINTSRRKQNQHHCTSMVHGRFHRKAQCFHGSGKPNGVLEEYCPVEYQLCNKAHLGRTTFGHPTANPLHRLVPAFSKTAQRMFLLCGLKKKPRGQPLYPYASVSVSIGFLLCIGLQCFRSSGSKVATFPYKCSMRSTLCQVPAPAGKSQLFSTSVAHKVHFGSSSWKVATFQ